MSEGTVGARVGDGAAASPYTRIDIQTSVELTAWANALHVSEEELKETVAIVGSNARDVITYLLKRPDSGRARES
jgi:hypothetical protein